MTDFFQNKKNIYVKAGIIFLSLILLSFSYIPSFADDFTELETEASFEALLNSAIVNKLIYGAVVAVGNSDRIVFTKSVQSEELYSNSPKLSADTIFDLASLTKVIATAPAIMKLVEQQKISLIDPITKYFPELENSSIEDITILNLLTHTSGLVDVSIPENGSIAELLSKVEKYSDTELTGKKFLYADINFILLAELVKRVAGANISEFCRYQIFAPLTMDKTFFTPEISFVKNIAPTLIDDKRFRTAVVQDENARRLGGVAGHAGLFSTVNDISKLARAIINRGKFNNKVVFSEKIIEQMTSPYFFQNGSVVRGLGWDIESRFSSPKGKNFGASSFGHTGYSGTSLWIDPEKKIFVIMLTVRKNYSDKKGFSRLRSDVSTLASSFAAN